MEIGVQAQWLYNHRASLTLFRACDLPERLTHLVCPPTHSTPRFPYLASARPIDMEYSDLAGKFSLTPVLKEEDEEDT